MHLTWPDNPSDQTLQLPGSKSISNRLLIIRALVDSRALLRGLSEAEDTKALSDALSDPFGNHHIEEGGTTFRFLLAYLAGLEGYVGVLSAGNRLAERPHRPLVEALRSCGAEITGDKPPYRIKGKKLDGGSVTLDGSLSSQFASALLMIAPKMRDGLELTLNSPVSGSYLEMTVGLMKESGIGVNRQGNIYQVGPGQYRFKSTEVEPDWSAAAVWAGLVVQSPVWEVELPGLQAQSLQGDSKVVEALAQLGLHSNASKNGITLTSEFSEPQSLDFDVKDTPDLALPLAAATLGRGADITLTGIQTLSLKESNRLEGLQMLVEAIGGNSLVETDRIKLIPGKSRKIEKPCPVFNDHRMAFAWTILLPRFGHLEIESPEVVQKSYPQFWDHLRSIGVIVSD